MPLLSSTSRLAVQHASPNARLSSSTSKSGMPSNKTLKPTRPSPYIHMTKSPWKPGQEALRKIEALATKPPKSNPDLKLNKASKGATIENKWMPVGALTPPPKQSTAIATPPRPRSGSMLCCSAVISNHLVAPKSPILASPLSRRGNPTNSIVQKTSSPSTSPRVGPHPKARSRLSLTPRRSDLEIIKVRKEAASLREENNFLRKQLQELKTKNTKTGKFRKQRLTFDNKTSLGNDSTDTVISQLRLKLRESEKNNQLKLEEQRSALNKQLKQASELVRICLGKVKEAEETAKKVPALEMELIVLRRQLATDRSERRFSSMSSSASCDTGFKSGSDYDLDQSHHCKSRSDLSCSSSQSDLEENTKETYNDSPVVVSAKEANMRLLSSDEAMGRLSYYEDETILPRLEKLKSCSPAKLPERNSDMNMSMFENLLKEHQKALDVIGALERKFCEQHNEMRTLKDNVDTISSTQQFTKPDNQQQDASLFRTLHSIQYKNLSYEEMGMIVFKALSLAEENHVLDYKKFSSNMIEVSKQNDVLNQL